MEALASADVVVHDGLIDPRVLDLAPPDAHRISVAKRRARHTLPHAKQAVFRPRPAFWAKRSSLLRAARGE